MPEIFDSLTPALIHQRGVVHDACRLFNRNPSKANLKRLAQLFKRFGNATFIAEGFYCDYGDKISLGDRVFINTQCTMLDGGQITIGDDCLIGPHVQLITINHAMSAKQRLNKENVAQDIMIGNNVWIGAGCIILPGVTIGNDSVIGAASVVTHDVEPGCLYVGNPARKVRRLGD